MAFYQRVLLAAAAMAPLGLGACQGAGPSASSLDGFSSGAPIAVESIDGPPDPVKTALAAELVSAASARKVEIAEAGAPARYRLRGYLSTETMADGDTALAFVWDVFDSKQRRATRIAGTSPVRNASAKPWSGLDKETLAKLAARSMDEIAGFLSGTGSGTAMAMAEPGPDEAEGDPALSLAP
jgi:hypothetical protein